ncbi:SpaH/EbpB family LPXTG-anchored major pilin [Streptococcus equi]|uniref:SpaH/EbpB family LPXTG-anchored major pilin n=1 Tax=Streptococcus equi TaxID=1336 RepID=UPI001E50CD7D|nr:SpaH/EbpB family LPXTG-anchored major pilin [Streptococcus equi]MCD3403832.1 SpaH/EbpB family LPXTG-anchored major pilin [Streptococcus equi subsp. zooepidemicus]
MTLSRKLLYAAATLLLVAGPAIETVSQLTNGIVVKAEEQKILPKAPETTKVNVFKVAAEDYKQSVKDKDGIENKDGKVLSLDELQNKLAEIGAEVKMLGGVTFRAYLIIDDNFTDTEAKKIKTVEDANNSPKLKFVEQGGQQKTDSSGKAVFDLKSKNSNKNARYLFIESDAPEGVSSAIAVPFVMTLPASSSDGRGYLDSVNVYPKNIQGDEPKPGKDVKTLGNNILPAQIGEDIEFFLKGTIPTNIQDYTTYYFTDNLDNQLSLVSESKDFVVSFGDKNNENHTLLNATDYNVNITGKKIEVKLTKTGIEKVAKNTTLEQRKASMKLNENDKIYDVSANTNEAPFIQVNFKAKINSLANLGKPINNKTTITFNHKSHSGEESELRKDKERESDKTVVITAGANFTKVEAGHRENKLEGATFKIYVDAVSDKALTWTEELILINKANGENSSKFEGPVEVGQDIVLKSSEIDKGKFGFSGLPLGVVVEKTRKIGDKTVITAYAEGVEGKVDDPSSPIETKLSRLSAIYYLKEVKAPAGYVKNENPIKFVLSARTHETPEIEVELGDSASGSKLVENTKRPSIPNTGSIGTAIFVAIGVAVMAFAAKGMKRRSDEG